MKAPTPPNPPPAYRSWLFNRIDASNLHEGPNVGLWAVCLGHGLLRGFLPKTMDAALGAAMCYVGGSLLLDGDVRADFHDYYASGAAPIIPTFFPKADDVSCVCACMWCV